MVKMLLVLLLLIGVMISGCSQIQEEVFIEKPMINEIEKDKEPNIIEKEAIRIGKIYDWNIELILCKECSPYRTENISQNELEEIKDEVISNFEEGEVIFDKFEQNSLFVNATNGTEDKIRKGINLKSAEIKTVYSRMIIVEEDQKESLKDEDIYICEEDRECVGVSADCCGCGMGGTATTINKDYLNYWGNKLKIECKGIACLAVISKHWTCSAKPKCVKGRCELIK